LATPPVRLHTRGAYRSWVESSDGIPLKAYTDKTYSTQSRVHLGALGIDLFENSVELGRLVAVHEGQEGAPFKKDEENGLMLRGTFHDGASRSPSAPRSGSECRASFPGLARLFPEQENPCTTGHVCFIDMYLGFQQLPIEHTLLKRYQKI